MIDRSSAAVFTCTKKKPLWRQSEVIPKVNSIEVFEIPACRSTQGRPFISTTNISNQVLLSPFRKTRLPVLTMPFSSIQNGPSATGQAAHEYFSVGLEAAKQAVISGVPRDATLGAFRLIPGHPTGQQIELSSPTPSHSLARLNPDNSPAALCIFLSEICADEENSHPPGLG